MTGMTPDEWLANFEAKVADVQQKAAAFRANLEASGASEQSEDGTLRVTVAPNGALTDLAIQDSALRRHSGAELAAEIMKLTRAAQRAAAGQVADAFAPLAGTSPEPARTARRVPPRRDDEDYSNDQIFGDD